jgi:hypothetical protein
VNLWVELEFPISKIVDDANRPNDNDIFWGVNFRPVYPRAEKEWDGIIFSVLNFDKTNASAATITYEDSWSNTGMLPVLDTSG